MNTSFAFAAPLRRIATLPVLALLALTVACGDDDGVGVPEDLGLPVTAQLSGTVGQGGVSIVRFVAGRSGPTRVALCGPAGTNFDLYLPQLDRNGTGTGNCESITFDADIATTYRIEVIATSGAGPFNLCYGPADAETPCAVTAPVIDATIPAGYYALAEGRTGTNLLTALHAIIDDQRVLGYDAARDSLYANVEDPDNDNVLFDVYVGNPRPNVSSRSSALAAGLNAEHSWPQSLGAASDPAMSDLHILFPSDETANTRRSNFPFGMVVRDTTYVTALPPEVTNLEERSVLGRDAQGRTVFEPRDSKKGDIARAIFYFYVRYNYQRTPNFTLTNFNIEEQTLLEWARLDPVDDFERARNNLAFRAQGNRNPFIDRPEFLTMVGDFPN